MSAVILDAMERESNITKILKEIYKDIGEDMDYFVLRDKNILPCRSCGACGYKSPGKCVFKDDMHEILRAIAKGSTIILLTPIKFGGYPSCLKKAVDKFMSLSLPLYTVKHGHLLHPPRYGEKSLVGIGVYDGSSKAQEESFKKLVENNALNMHSSHKEIILRSSEDMEKVKNHIKSMLREVSC